VCEDFITADTELVSAWHITHTEKQRSNVSNYQHYIACAEHLGIPGMVHSIDQMMVLDFLLCNQDRHYNNFGAVRNAETLQWMGAAPIFDCGTSVWYDTPTNLIRAREDSKTKPFRGKHFDQIKLVTDFSWVDTGALRDIGEEFHEILRPSAYIDEARRTVLCKAVETRVKLLESLIAERQAQKPSLLGTLSKNQEKVEA
jgi:hypothetical protein